MSEPECMFVQDALGACEGDFEPNLILIRTTDGLYRKANGQDLLLLAERHPHFIRQIKARHRDEKFYW